MQIGIRLHDSIKAPLEELIPYVKKQGFCCGHLALKKVVKDYLVEPSALTPGYAMYLNKLFTSSGVDIAVLGCYLNLAVPDDKALKQIYKAYEAHIRLASILKVGVVGTETGAPNMEYIYEPKCHTKEALDLFINRLRPVVHYAEKMGVIFGIEPVSSHIVYNAKVARAVLDEINSPNLKIIFDPVNLLSIENYKEQKAIIKEAIELLGEDIAVIHLKDFIVKEDHLQSVAAGTGLMEYEQIIKFIKKEKPFIHTTLENTSVDNAAQAKRYIEEIWNHIE